MKSSQLIKVLRTFSEKEQKDFRKWVNSPFHNQRTDVIDLYQYLSKNDRWHNDQLIKKTAVFKKIFPNTPYDDDKMRQTMHFLLKSVEDFLSYEELTKDKVRAEIALARNYRRRGLSKAFEKNIRKVEKNQLGRTIRNGDYYQSNFQIQKELYSYLTANKRIPQINWQEINDTLDISYLANKLYNSCLMIIQKRLSEADFEAGILPAILDHLHQSRLLKIPAIAIYYYMYMSHTNPDEEQYFFALRTSIIQNKDLFSQTESREMLIMAINFCINKMNRGETVFNKEALNLYKYGVENHLILENNQISRWTFQNIVGTASNLGEFRGRLSLYKIIAST